MSRANKVTKQPTRRGRKSQKHKQSIVRKMADKLPEGEDSAADGPVYFWRETHPETGYLSQWYACPFHDREDKSIIYKTAEQ